MSVTLSFNKFDVGIYTQKKKEKYRCVFTTTLNRRTADLRPYLTAADLRTTEKK